MQIKSSISIIVLADSANVILPHKLFVVNMKSLLKNGVVGRGNFAVVSIFKLQIENILFWIEYISPNNGHFYHHFAVCSHSNPSKKIIKMYSRFGGDRPNTETQDFYNIIVINKL